MSFTPHMQIIGQWMVEGLEQSDTALTILWFSTAAELLLVPKPGTNFAEARPEISLQGVDEYAWAGNFRETASFATVASGIYRD